MPHLNSGGGDDLGANDEMIAFKDEGEQEEKASENALTETDLADVKSSLVNESETGQDIHPAPPDPEAITRSRDGQRIYQDKSKEHIDDVSKQHQDGGMFKGTTYSGYPHFLMLQDPYLANGSLSPTVIAAFSKKTTFVMFEGVGLIGPCLTPHTVSSI